MTKKTILRTSIRIIVVLIIVFSLFIIYYPVKERSIAWPHCKNNLKTIATACLMYANSNDGTYPPNLTSLIPNEISTPDYFSCDLAKERDTNSFGCTRDEHGPNIYFVYLPGLSSKAIKDTLLAFCPFHKDKYITTVYVDTVAKYLDKNEFKDELNKMLKEIKYRDQYSKEAIELMEYYLKEQP